MNLMMCVIFLKYIGQTNLSIKKKKSDILINAQNFYDGREMFINAFKNKIFPTVNLTEYPQYSSEEDIG